MHETKLQKPKAIFMGAVLYIHNYLHTIYPFYISLIYLGVTFIQADITQYWYSKLQQAKEENINFNSHKNNETHWSTATTVKLNTGPHESQHIVSLSVIHGFGIHRLYSQSYI